MMSRAPLLIVISLAAAMAATSSHGAEAQGSDMLKGMMAGDHMGMSPQAATSQRLKLPPADPASGRKLFAAKGCVVCHSVNGVGGADGAKLDASTMPGMTNPLDFVANMWRGAEPMIALQKTELGGQVEFTGAELGDIIAFLHDEAEQKKFSPSDIPPKVKAAMEKMDGGGDEKNQGKGADGGMKMK